MHRPYRTLAASLIAAGLMMSSAAASAAVNVELGIGPPPPRYEVVPAPRSGYVWAPGYWDYAGHNHVWRKGHWEREHHGEHYVAGGWSEHDGKWHLDRGHWDH